MQDAPSWYHPRWGNAMRSLSGLNAIAIIPAIGFFHFFWLVFFNLIITRIQQTLCCRLTKIMKDAVTPSATSVYISDPYSYIRIFRLEGGWFVKSSLELVGSSHGTHVPIERTAENVEQISPVLSRQSYQHAFMRPEVSIHWNSDEL